MRWIDRNGHEHEADFAGFTATVLQHEIDHLNGKLFIDYLSQIKKTLIKRTLKELEEEARAYLAELEAEEDEDGNGAARSS